MSEIVQGLKKLLASTYFLYLKTQNFHWNIQGEDFFEFHELFEAHYGELAEAIDTIAEAIRIYNERAPGSFAEFIELTDIAEIPHQLASHDMIAALLNDHKTLITSCTQLASLCQKSNDFGTLLIVGERLKSHQKTVWMLESWSQ